MKDLSHHALARTAVWTGSARRRRYWIWHQSQEPVGRSVGRKWRGIPQGRLSWRRCKPRQADAGVQGNPKVVTRETASPFDERSCCRLWAETKTCRHTQHRSSRISVVKIAGRWRSDAFIGYTRYQAELMAGIAQRMVSTSYVVKPS